MRPFIHINCAMSADGKIAGSDRKQVRISSEEDKQRVKDLRKKYDAILVGVGTVIADDPHLTVKGLGYDENPVRIVIDPHGRTPRGARVVDDTAPTVIATDEKCEKIWDNADTLRCGDPFDLNLLMESLPKLGIKSILVEGGGETISSFFRERMVDVFSVYVGNMIIGGRTAPTPADGDGWISENGVKLELKNCERMGEGVLLTYEPKF